MLVPVRSLVRLAIHENYDFKVTLLTCDAGNRFINEMEAIKLAEAKDKGNQAKSGKAE